MTNRILTGVVLACAMTTLSACQTSEERAEEHFQTALEHIANADVARAKVEFQNVFKLNGHHRDARATFAKMQRDSGDVAAAYGQYLRLVEQFPDDLEGRRALSELSLENANWDELKRHGEYLAKLAPDDLTARISVAALAYRDAIVAGNESARDDHHETVLALLDEDPERQSLRKLVIDDFIRLNDWKSALTMLEIALATKPDDQEFQLTKLKILYQVNDPAQIENQLTKMIDMFPQDERIVAALVQWHTSRAEIDKAEALLRARADTATQNAEPGATLVRFLTEMRGQDVALAELDKIIDSGTPHQDLFRALRASIRFDTGLRDQAINEMQSILKTAEPSADTDNVKVGLASMLEITGNPVGARALIEEVLERDSTHSEALKKRAGWLIVDDQTGDAIATLRAALADTPQDPEIMTLMAQAHERDGNKGLMAEMLALAVENSGGAPAESLRYARHLISQKTYRPAEDVLLGALRQQTQNVAILSSLGDLYIKMQDWGRNSDVVRALHGIGSDQSVLVANELTARRLAAQNRDQELNAFLETVTASTDGFDTADIAIVRQHLRVNDTARALAHIDGLLKTAPNAPVLRFLQASVLAQSDQAREAEGIFQSLLDENDQSHEIWVALYRLQRAGGNKDQAAATLSSALSALPDNPQIQWIDAGEKETAGDIDGAIAIYEDMYASDSSNMIVANNLASLLADHRTDTKSLERAYVVARRLRGSDLAPFQDTYGWIAYRLQNFDEAVSYLEPAAAGLDTNATVQFHLAMAYAAINRDADALAQFEKTNAMLDPENLPEFAPTITSEIARLSAPKE